MLQRAHALSGAPGAKKGPAAVGAQSFPATTLSEASSTISRSGFRSPTAFTTLSDRLCFLLMDFFPEKRF